MGIIGFLVEVFQPILNFIGLHPGHGDERNRFEKWGVWKRAIAHSAMEKAMRFHHFRQYQKHKKELARQSQRRRR